METLTLRPGEDQAGRRADVWLSEAVDGLTRSAAARLLEEGLATCGGKPLAKSARLTGNETVEILLPEPEPLDLIPQDIPLDVVYEDGDVIVVNKPKGLVVHPAPGHPDGTLVNALLFHCGSSLSGVGGALRPGIVHRIDRDTSGLIIAAKNDKAHLALAAQLQDHSLFRLYHGVAVGGFKADSGTVSAPIGRHKTDRKRMSVTPEGRVAVTHWQVVDSQKGHTHLTCRLETGRTHQIRVHMAYLGHPLLGDVVYGAKRPVPGLAGQCLHAAQLTFTHPTTGECMTVEAPLPDWFSAVLKRYGLQ